MSNFAFLAAEFPAVHEAVVEAERQTGVLPTAAAFLPATRSSARAEIVHRRSGLIS
jgi:hypothetical protein